MCGFDVALDKRRSRRKHTLKLFELLDELSIRTAVAETSEITVMIAYGINVFGVSGVWLDFTTAQRAAVQAKGTEDKSMYDCPVAITTGVDLGLFLSLCLTVQQFCPSALFVLSRGASLDTTQSVV